MHFEICDKQNYNEALSCCRDVLTYKCGSLNVRKHVCLVQTPTRVTSSWGFLSKNRKLWCKNDNSHWPESNLCHNIYFFFFFYHILQPQSSLICVTRSNDLSLVKKWHQRNLWTFDELHCDGSAVLQQVKLSQPAVLAETHMNNR